MSTVQVMSLRARFCLGTRWLRCRIDFPSLHSPVSVMMVHPRIYYSKCLIRAKQMCRMNTWRWSALVHVPSAYMEDINFTTYMASLPHWVIELFGFTLANSHVHLYHTHQCLVHTLVLEPLFGECLVQHCLINGFKLPYCYHVQFVSINKQKLWRLFPCIMPKQLKGWP